MVLKKHSLIFQSTQPEWAATRVLYNRSIRYLFQSTQPEWAATKGEKGDTGAAGISIHAARVGCDRWLLPMAFVLYDFNPRSPSGLRPALQSQAVCRCRISIHAARVGCDENAGVAGEEIGISIHAARVGCDKPKCRQRMMTLTFQSTQPEWAATVVALPKACRRIISIHAARVGCDVVGSAVVD